MPSRRARAAASSPWMRDRSMRRSVLEATLLTFCPPGPEERTACTSCASAGTTTPASQKIASAILGLSHRATVPRAGELIVAVEEVADAAEDRALLLAAAAEPRNGLVDAVGEAAERERLQPHLAGSSEAREEESLAAEERGFDLADVLDVVGDGRLQRHETAGVDAQRLSRS